jgi:hypothetical protein
MTAAAGHRGLFGKGVRRMTIHARSVPVAEERAGRHERLANGVTRRAAGKRVCRRSMLVLMTRGAHLGCGSMQRSVSRGDVLVAADTGAGLGRRVFVRVMAVGTITAAVHRDGGDVALLLGMTAQALGRPEVLVVCRSCQRDACRVRWRKGMTGRAVGLDAAAEAICGLHLGVSDRAFFLVAADAAGRGRDAHGVTAQIVALRAGNVLLCHVLLVPGAGTRGLPGKLHVYTCDRR